ncbi:MAG TPA: FtsX-like permease family protein [Gemmatimonadaceae bacterium]|nr:FtsX-like permease family protein [Gemmatimonadaceae bacterium]
MSSISLGVAALVAIDSFTTNVTQSVREQSRALLGGDVVLRAREKYSVAASRLMDSLAQHGIGVSHVTTFASMALATSGGTRLVQVRAVSPTYPFYGEITTDPAASWARLQSGENAIVDPSILISLNTHVGDSIALGSARFAIIGTIKNVPGDVGVSAAIGPRVFIPQRYVGATGLLVFGSRAEYETLLRTVPVLSPARFAARFEKRFEADTPRVSLRTETENEVGITESINQLGSFLGIVGLVALLLGGIGVASGVHAFVMRKIDTVAVLRCLGATSTQVLAIYVLQAAAMGLLGAAVGAALGVAFQFLLPWVLKDFLPVDVQVTLAPQAIALGLGVGVWVALIFALRPLLSLRRISPLQTLRRESDATVMRRAQRDSAAMVVTFAIIASVLAIALARAGTVQRALAYSLAIAAVILVLWLTALLLALAARRLVRPAVPFVFRQGIANLYRPGNQTRAVILALGFGVFLMSTLYQVQHSLLRQLDVKLDQARANVVFFDIQQNQDAGVEALIRQSGYTLVQRAPIVPMRIVAINGVSVATLAKDTARKTRRSPWALRREFRSSYRDRPAASEKIVSGRWFAPGDTTPQMSIERDLASELKVRLGDTVTWNVQGVQIPARITSIREVSWARFEPNFFVVFNAASLQDAPQQFALLVDVPTATGVAMLQRSVVQQYPNVSSLDLSLIQRTVNNVLGKVTSAIRFMALVSLAFGIPVLFSAVAATRRERLREGVLLKTLGATRRQVGRIMLSEYALLGVLGSLAGVLLSSAGAWLLTRYVFETAFSLAVYPILAVALVMTLLSIVIGFATGREVFRQTPMAALREA